MPTKLDEILAHTRLRVTEQKRSADLSTLEKRAEAHRPRGFASGLRRVSVGGAAVIAELKKASPSKGLLRETFEPAGLAQAFQVSGAAALSVLTDEKYFQGSLRYLEAVSAAVNIPVLRKDFIVDPFQVVEARAAGADAILLIVAAHEDRTLRELAVEAAAWGLDVLCEAHTREEIDRSVDLGFNVIGVNSRNLKTLEVDSNLQEELAGHLPTGVLRVAESGVGSHQDILRLGKAGYDAFLIGEALMRQQDPGAHLSLLMGHQQAAKA